MKISGIFYGYWVLLACFLLTVISAGSGPVSFSFFVTSLETDLGWSRTEIMTGFTVASFCVAISSPILGRLVHRYGARKVVSLSAFSPCLGFILLSQMSALWQYYVGYILFGLGAAAMGPVITTLVISNWFVRRRGMAIGTLVMGTGIGGMIFTPLVLVYLLPNLGWSNTYLTFAIITGGVAIPLAALVIRTKPADMGLLPDGRDAAQIDSIEHTQDTRGLTFRSAVGTLTFWLMGMAVLFQSTHMGVMQNQVPHLEDTGFSARLVASAISIFSIVSTISMPAFGWLCDKINVKFAAIISLALTTIGIILLINVNADSPTWCVIMYVILFGLGLGGWMPCTPLLTSTNFGLLSYGPIFGALNAFHMVGSGLTPIIFGYLFDRIGSYEWAFIVAMISIALAIPAILGIRRPRSFSSSNR